MFDQLLEGIGALSMADSKKATSRSGNYQDNAVAPVEHEFDNEAAQQEDEDQEEDKSNVVGRPDGTRILSAVVKVMSTLFYCRV
jgi:hypothetical protein